MALILLNPGETAGPFGQFSTDLVFGSTGNETAVVAANGKATLDGSFNAGGDKVKILGLAGDYTASVVGSSLKLVTAGGADIRIPFGINGATIEFNDATRTLKIDGSDLKLGTQVIAASGNTEVADGSGGGSPPPTPPSSGDEIFLSPNVDRGNVFNGTTGDDVFIADIEQVAGLQVNTLGTGDRLNNQTAAAGGNDELQAQITRGSTYGDGNAPIQPRMNGLQISKLEALHSDLEQVGSSYYGGGNNTTRDDELIDVIGEGNWKILQNNNTEVFFNAKDVRGHNEIWSWRSDANLNILDLTTISTDGGHDNARNTEDITIGMGYTGSDNTRWEASDLKVFFDPDFLISGKANKSELLFFILDEEADLANLPINRSLNRINVDGIRFTVNGGAEIDLSAPGAAAPFGPIPPNPGGDWNTFVAALQAPLAALKAANAVPADTTLTVDFSRTDTTFNDAGNVTRTIPAIVLRTNTSAVFAPLGFSQIEAPIGEYDVYGRIDDAAEETGLPVCVNIALEKAGEGALDVCDGGALVVGAMDKYNQGIPCFKVTVYGDESRPSILRYLDSTGGVLETIDITSDNSGFPTNTYARLAIGSTNWGLTYINASTFKGDLQLGSPHGGKYGRVMVGAEISAPQDDDECDLIYDLHTLIATGGGDVSFYGSIEDGGLYSYTTGAGNDNFYLQIDRDALDFSGNPTTVGDLLTISTGAGNDVITTRTNSDDNNETPNQIILQNVTIDGGEGNDTIWTAGEGSYRIIGGDGNDTIYTDNTGGNSTWIFNVDMGAALAQDVPGSDATPGQGRGLNTFDLPGVPLQRSLIGGSVLTVTFSGAGVNSLVNAAPGANIGTGVTDGGVMAYNGSPGDEGEAVLFRNGIESQVNVDVEGVQNFYGTQRDINNAIVKAINEHAVLNKLLVASIADDNTLVVRTLIDGEFHTEDLDIQLSRPAGVFTAAIIAEAATVGISTTGIIAGTTLIASGEPGRDAFGTGYGMSLNNEFYSGVDNNWNGFSNNQGPDNEDYFNNLNNQGSSSSNETDNIITGGVGDDVVVLALSQNANLDNNYWSLDGQLYDGASNEVLVFTGDFGKDTVINFQVAGDGTYRPAAEGGPFPPLPRSGFDMLNVNAYLTSGFATTLEDLSGGDLPVASAPGKTLQPSEVMIIDFINDLNPLDGDGIQTFAGLNATIIAAAINASANTTNYGDLLQDGSEFATSDTLNPGRDVSTLLMVQNDQNLGEYKFFQISWRDDTTNGVADPIATVLERGIVDFGASLTGQGPATANSIDEINFIGSVENQQFDGAGVNQFGPDSYPVFFV